MSDTITPEEALCKLADEFDALANSLNAQAERQKTAAAGKAADFGTLGSREHRETDALTAFLLGN